MIKPNKTKWPLGSDFVSALQNPDRAFYKDPVLQKADIKKSKMGLPQCASGNFAVVFQGFHASRGKFAIRCFTKSVDERTERYQHISQHLQGITGSNPLVDFQFRNRDEGIKVDGTAYPFITMEWVEGETFDKWLERKSGEGDKNAIASMSDRWRDLVGQLREDKISHGDLQHGNVMVTPDEQLKLVDYDCMCVPTLVGRKNMELGVVPYQHPERNGDTRLSLDLDNFSANFIFAALRALAVEPGLWAKHVQQRNYDKILFHREDFDQPGQSSLFRDLKNSPDKDVQRYANDLSDHWNGSFEDVPPLKAFVWSWDPVRDAFKAGDLRKMIELVDRQTGQDVPADLVPKIQKAREMVSGLDNLVKAVNAGDEQSMVRHYKPDLLKGWSEAKQPLAVAKDAEKVILLLGQMDSFHKNKQGRELVDLWEKNAGVLEKRKSMEAVKKVISQWGIRNKLCDRLLALKDQSPAPVDKLEENWKKLKDLGGHPEIDPHGEEIVFLVRQQRSYEKWTSIAATLSETNDLQRVSLWKEDLFENWPTAEAQRPLLDASRQRLVIIDELKKLCQVHDAAVTIDGERQLVSTVGQLPDSYPHSLDDRIKLAQGRLQATKQLASILGKDPIIDTVLASCYQNLKELGGQALVPDDAQRLCDLAEERKPIIVDLEQLPEDLAEDELDEKLLALWNEKLLSSCQETKKWTKRHAQAVKRRKILDSLDEDIKSGDGFKIKESADESCLQDFPLPNGVKEAIKKAEHEVLTVQKLREAITEKDNYKFLDHFDKAVLKKYESKFEDLRDGLDAMIQAAIMPPRYLGLETATFGASLHTQKNGKEFKITARWDWPSARFTSHCLVGIAESPPAAGLSCEDSSVHYLDPVTRERYEAAGGQFQIYVESAWNGHYVLVWAEVDIGIGVRTSDPIVLGQIQK